MKKLVKYSILASVCLVHHAYGQTTINRDPEIEQMVKEVSSDSLKANINKLVTFGTRSTLSTVTDKKHGIGAAREWVVQRFNDFARNSGGRLTAFVDTTTIPADGKRVDVATSL